MKLLSVSIRNKTTTAFAEWNGTLKEGNGVMSVGTEAFKNIPFTFAPRFESEAKTNPEELIGAAHAGCYSMFLSALLTKKDLKPESVKTTATVTLGEGPAVTKIELKNETKCTGIDATAFDECAKEAKEKCPISKALAGVAEIKLNSKLI